MNKGGEMNLADVGDCFDSFLGYDVVFGPLPSNEIRH